MTEMKALLRFPGERKVMLADCPVPSLKPHSVLVRTSATVISPGTEFNQVKQTTASLMAKAWQRPDLVALTLKSLRSDGARQTFNRAQNRLGQPLPLGYCGVGTLHAVGDGISNLAVGQRVAIGGMGHANHAQWNVVPKNFACAVPDEVCDQQAAFTTLYALALHALRQGRTGIGDRVAIFGAGLVGQLVAQTALAAGARTSVIEPNSTRRKMGETIGATATYHTAQDAPGDQFDTVYICAPAHSNHTLIDDAARLCRERGTIVCVGDVAPYGTRDTLYRKEIDLRQVRSYGPGRYDPAYEEAGQDYPEGHVRWTVNRYMKAALDLMADGRLDPLPLITREITFDAIAGHFTRGADPDDLATVVHFAHSEMAQGGDSKSPNAHADTQDFLVTPQPISMPRNQPRRDKPIKLGLIGTGNYLGSTLLPPLRKHARIDVLACASQSGLSALAAARKFRAAKSCSGATDILDNAEINSVIIATRHDSHATLADRALAAGKHVWLEKPIAITHEDLERLRPHATNQKSVFMVGHNRRYAPISQKLRKLLPPGATQFHYRVRFKPLSVDHWMNRPDQGGRTLGEISHFIDLMTYLSGAKITDITCDWQDRKRGDSIWRVYFSDGSVGEVSYLHTTRNEPKEILEISAPDFGATLHDWRRIEVNGKVVMRNWLARNKGQENALNAFVTAIENSAPVPGAPSLDEEINLMERIVSAAKT
uniref:Threonine dehydrogenase and related Zn-dependent dehydrogenases n=1 Tax=uncultured Rhodospirillales bacterium HF0200_01O14 TaxID=710787 RepID=E0XTW0_9PROT|nr:threonine dehydrogenase and related Zn-dependent dehydrogenases [uncultured Rhodospirillales bacterium HF0200_01O14]